MHRNGIKMLLGGMMSALSLLLTMEVILRSLFGTSLTWSYEVARTIMIWMVYLGAIVLAWDNNAIKITLLKEKYPVLETISRVVMLVTHLAISIISINFLTVIIPYARTSSTTGLPIWINYLIIPLAFFAILLHRPSRPMEDIC